MIEQLRETCRRLLEDVKVDVIIGYGQSSPERPIHAVFITEPDRVDQLIWNDRCFPNLTVYLTKREVRAFDRVGIVVKGCDARALVVLEQEKQIDRKTMHVIGVACDGVGKPLAAKCAPCNVHMPKYVDEVIGTTDSSSSDSNGPYAELDALLQKTPADRWAFWKQELARCIKCYACRAVCPTCYCPQCIVDKNRPVCLDTSATLMGNFAWHITRAFHQAGRCTGCDECTRVCPVGINLSLLNRSLARAAENEFSYRAGVDPETLPPIGAYSLQDKENFIL